MRIFYEGLMQGADHTFLPHHHVANTLAYSSTHDSDTCAGWWAGTLVAQHWGWRLEAQQLTEELATRLHGLTRVAGRS